VPGGLGAAGAVVAGVLAVILAVVSTKSGESNLERVFVWSALIAAMLRFATPLVFAAMGGMLCERSGVINIGLEGMMILGTFGGAYFAYHYGPWAGVAGAILLGALGGLVHATATVIMSGLVFLLLWFMALSALTSLLIAAGFGVVVVAASAASDLVEMVLDAITAVVFGVLGAIAAFFAAIFSLFGS
jgi:ABC-type uncharacterized transport system permease subunit